MMILVSLPADHISIPNHIVIRYNIFLIYLNIYRQHLGIFWKRKFKYKAVYQIQDIVQTIVLIL